MDMVSPRRFDVFLVGFDPAVGHETTKTRPAIIVSPNELNEFLGTVLVVPLTSTVRNLPFRLRLRFEGRDGEAAPDQMRAVDVRRLVKKLGHLARRDQDRMRVLLQEMFA
jgi:mRNA interferase MazF